MRIAIIGAGNVGGALGRGWLDAGHDVMWGVRDAARYPDLPVGRVADPAAAIADADAIVLATPWQATEAAIAALGDLTGRTVIDTTNPLQMGADGLELSVGFETSAGELVASWAPGAHVFKALNTTGAGNMGSAHRYTTRPVMFVAGDHAAGKEIVLGLVGDLGFEPVDAGPLRTARLLEPMAMLWIDQALKRGWGPEFAFSVARLMPA